MTSKGIVPKLWRFTKRLFFWVFIIQFILILLFKWCYPPITCTQISNIISGHGLKRDYVNWNDISYNVKLAAIASEDQLFPDHNGFDWDAIEKSFKPRKSKKNKKSKIPLGGGASTISQQTAKNVFLWQGGGYIRKLPEFYFTQLIEWTWGKKRILETYLNVIEMGKGIFGIEAAAQAYFHKAAKDLSREEAAKIIACLPNPKLFTVVPMSDRVQWRYPQIQREMNNIEDDEDVQAIIK
jgi:monofunctional glycosyltransferase